MKDCNVFIKLVFLLLFCSCTKRNNPYKTYSLEGPIIDSISIEIDDKIAIKNFTSTFEKQELIKLETTKTSLISSISKIVKHNNGNIYVFDWYSDYSVLCFDAKGKFKFKLKKIGRGPHEYIDYSFGNINDYTGDIELIVNTKRNLMVYDSLGNFKNKFKLPYSSTSFCSVKDKRYFYKGYTENKEEDFNFRLYSTDYRCENIFERFLPYKVSKDPNVNPVDYIYGFSRVKKGEYRFIEGYNDTIYKIEESSCLPIYKLVFNGYESNKPKDFLYNHDKYGEKKEWARKLKVPKLRTFYESENYIMGSYITNLEDSSYIKYFIYDKKNKSTLYNGYGVLFSDKIKVHIYGMQPKLTFNSMPAIYMHPEELDKAITENKIIEISYGDKKNKVRNILKSYFEFDNGLTANPIIITYK